MNKPIIFVLAFLIGVLTTAVASWRVLRIETATRDAYTNALAVYQIIDGLEKDGAKNLKSTEKWLCHIAFRMEFERSLVRKSILELHVDPALDALNEHRKSVELPPCKN